MKLTLDSINNINLFENLTGARVKDCFDDEGKIVFLVEEGSIKKAIGKEGSNIKRVSNIMKKDIKVVGFSDDVCKFVRNLIYPNKADDIKLEDKTVKIMVEDMNIKGRIFGRSKENLKKINSIVKKYFDVEVQVV
ncbi:MAG TPA: NusA-like transcription termination signal-binding factor [Candidatus Nanoarchaeia archaeon]|nr:NusA-like transcription termination signal-binding factor [Candidatus Nanoarchaeia archaeon]